MKKLKQDFKVLRTEFTTCPFCLTFHKLDIVKRIESHDESDEYEAIYEYCSVEDELWENEEMLRTNINSMLKAMETWKKKQEIAETLERR